MSRPHPEILPRRTPRSSLILLLLLTSSAAAAFAIPSTAAAQDERDPDTFKSLYEARKQQQAASTTDAEFRFMTAMLRHHAQGLQMIDLAIARAHRPEVRRLATRIRTNYEDETDMIRGWLREREEARTGRTGSWTFVSAYVDVAENTPALLPPGQIESLSQASGPRFDTEFLSSSVLHHTRALQLVDTLLAAAGGARDETVSRIVESLEGEQSAYVGHMRRMLREADQGKEQD